MSANSAKKLPVGVVIPVYKGELWLSQAIKSAVAAGDPSPEIIVVDDGSPDRSAEIARLQLSVADRGRLVRQRNAGVAVARNRGLSEVSQEAEACLFLDQDDLLVLGAIDRLREALQGRSEYVAVVGRATFIDERGTPIHPGRAEALLPVAARGDGDISFAKLAYRNCIWTPGQVLARTGVLRACGGFRKEVAPNDDWDLWLRLARLGRIGIVDEVTTLVRRHDRNVSADDHLMRPMEIALRALAYAEGDPIERRHLARGYRASERGFASDWFRFARDRTDAQRPFLAVKLLGRAGLFRLWSVLGLRAHAFARARAGLLSSTRTRGRRTERE